MKSVKVWKKKTLTTVLIIISSLVAVHIIQAAVAAEPGTDTDPLVTQSYVDQKFNLLSTQVNTLKTSVDTGISSLTAKDEELNSKIEVLTKTVDELTTKIDELTTEASELTTKVDELTTKNEEYKLQIDGLSKGLEEKTAALESRLTGIEKYGMFEALELTENQKLITGASAEIILRGGKATAIGGEGGGLSDITSGTGADIATGQDVPLNHLLLVSRDDGRGIKVVSIKAWVLVKGPYTIQ